jgi:hypothetical protein
MEAPLNKICNHWVGYRLRTAEDTDTPGTGTYNGLPALWVRDRHRHGQGSSAEFRFSETLRLFASPAKPDHDA